MTDTTIENVTWLQLQQVNDFLLSKEDLAGYESARAMINRAVGGDRAAKERCVAILNKYLAPEPA
jgi:hypothetical protein